MERVQRRLSELSACPQCGMFSGKRMIRRSKEDRYLVQCDTCGYRTKEYVNIRFATRAWNHPCRGKLKE